MSDKTRTLGLALPCPRCGQMVARGLAVQHVRDCPTPACNWTDDGDGNWQMDCGESFTLTEGSPSENKMAYCCGCGRVLREVPYTEAR